MSHFLEEAAVKYAMEGRESSAPNPLVFDLDPGSLLPFQRLCEAATVVKKTLDALCVDQFRTFRLWHEPRRFGASPDHLPSRVGQIIGVAILAANPYLFVLLRLR